VDTREHHKTHDSSILTFQLRMQVRDTRSQTLIILLCLAASMAWAIDIRTKGRIEGRGKSEEDGHGFEDGWGAPSMAGDAHREWEAREEVADLPLTARPSIDDVEVDLPSMVREPSEDCGRATCGARRSPRSQHAGRGGGGGRTACEARRRSPQIAARGARMRWRTRRMWGEEEISPDHSMRGEEEVADARRGGEPSTTRAWDGRVAIWVESGDCGRERGRERTRTRMPDGRGRGEACGRPPSTLKD
jgi:hypothetical protein